jgi:hypothetical protein
MRRVSLAFLFSLLLGLVACGSGSSDTINGNWSASLTNPDGSPAFSFSTTLNQNNGTTITGTNLTFSTTTPCFSSVHSETGGFTLTGNTSGSVTGAFELTVQSGTPSGNVLTMSGTVAHNTITGTWTLSGVTSGCTGSGNFTMTKG